jgi:hypothetical protein
MAKRLNADVQNLAVNQSTVSVLAADLSVDWIANVLAVTMWCLEILLLAILGKGRGASVQNRNV